MKHCLYREVFECFLETDSVSRNSCYSRGHNSMTVVFLVMGGFLFGAVACFVLFMPRTDSLMSMSGESPSSCQRFVCALNMTPATGLS